MGVIIVAIAAVLHASMASVLLDEIDTGLRARAATVEAALPGSLELGSTTPGLVESHEAFVQVLRVDGEIIETSSGFTQPLLAPDAIRRISRPTFAERRVQGVASGARLLAVPVTAGTDRVVVVVGSSLSDRADALHLIERFFLIGGPIALLLASVAGWVVAGVALRPVERMRRQASAISSAGRGQRLDVPEAHDEIARLATTLNDMLARIDDAARAERRFLDNASHELRTPLTALKAELDLARSRPRTAAELRAVVASASEETDRLARMASDLLLLARAHEGKLRVEREPVALDELIGASASLFAARAETAGVRIEVEAIATPVLVDPVRLRQAIDNLVDNALRHARHTVVITATADGTGVTLAVHDDGPGLAAGAEDRVFIAFERDARGERRLDDEWQGAGLGLAIVRMIAEAHGGTASAANAPEGGLTMTLTLPSGALAAGADQPAAWRARTSRLQDALASTSDGYWSAGPRLRPTCNVAPTASVAPQESSP